MTSALAVASFLVFLLLLVSFSPRFRRLATNAPLDIDFELPLPWLGYASSVVSLTGLLGAYFAVLLLAGIVAFAGVVVGVIVALAIIVHSVRASPHSSFEAYLASRRLSTSRELDDVLWRALALAQFGLAISELVLLRTVLVRGFALASGHATALAFGVALTCYFYCLLAGYDAVFRTDVVKFLAMLGLFVGLSMAATTLSPAQSALPTVHHLPWDRLSPLIRYPAAFVIGAIMGAALPLTTPDSWKRVLIAVKRGGRFDAYWVLIVAGCLPFVLITPALVRLFNAGARGLPSELLLSGTGSLPTNIVLVGMIAVFMSSFDSALVSGVHVLLMRPVLVRRKDATSLDRYRALIAGAFLFVLFAALAVGSSPANPYVVGNYLVGPFALLSGCLLSSGLGARPIRSAGIGVSFAAGVLGWTIYFLVHSVQNPFTLDPTPRLRTVAVGAAIFVATAVVTWVRRDRGRDAHVA